MAGTSFGPLQFSRARSGGVSGVLGTQPSALASFAGCSEAERALQVLLSCRQRCSAGSSHDGLCTDGDEGVCSLIAAVGPLF